MLLTSILVQGKRKNKVLRESLHQVRSDKAPKRAKNLVQEKRKNKGLRESLHQIRNGKAPKKTKNLVQRKRKNKVLRESLHQVQRVEAPKRTKDLVQEKRKNKVLRESLQQVRSRGAAPSPEPDAGNPSLCASSDPDPLFSRNERSRCTKCTAASSIYYAFFWGCKFKGSALATRTETASPAKSFPLGQRPIRPAAPHPCGEALATRTEAAGPAAPTHAAAPSPLRRSLLIGSAPPTRRSPARSGSAPPTRRSLRLPAQRRRPPTFAPTSAAAGCAP